MLDLNLLTAKDFIGVRAGLIAELGRDANRAVVLTRIHFRSDERWREALERDGAWWWRATYQTIADETGLSVKQVERCLKWLADEDYLVVASHRVEGPYDQTRSYRVNVDSAESGDHSPESGDVDSPESGDVPSIKTFKTLDGPKTNAEIDGAFDIWWQNVPKKAGKLDARKAYAKALTKATARTLFDGMRSYKALVVRDGRDPRFILNPATWLNGGHWEDDHGPVAGTGRDSIRSL